jgi:hypothetical protein
VNVRSDEAIDSLSLVAGIGMRDCLHKGILVADRDNLTARPC